MNISILKNIHVFSELNSAQLSHVDSKLAWQELKKGSIILSHQEYSDDVYFIATGSVRATTYSATGKEIAYQDLFSNETFGELSAIDKGKRTTTIITLEKSTIAKISADDFLEIVYLYPSVNKKVMHRLTGLIRFLCGRIYEFSALDVKDRIRAEMVRYARLNKTGSNSALITKMPTHEEIANKVSTHREAVTKELSHLVKLQLIEKQGRKIVVPDIDKLTATLLEEI